MRPTNSRTKRLRKLENIVIELPVTVQTFELVRLRTLHSPNAQRFNAAMRKNGSLEIVVASRKGHVVILPTSITPTGDLAGSRGDSFRYKARLQIEGIEVDGYVEGDSGWIELPHIPSGRRNLRY